MAPGPREVSVVVIRPAAALLLFLALATPAASQGTALTDSEQALLLAVNDARAAEGLQPLGVDTALTRAARSHSQELLATDVLAHGDFATRLRRFGARGPVLAENLAWGTGGLARAGAIVRAWLRSPGHRANLLRPGFRRIGLGAVVGEFAGHSGATVVTADFAGS
jgi:uncharacterized protein YkwD